MHVPARSSGLLARIACLLLTLLGASEIEASSAGASDRAFPVLRFRADFDEGSANAALAAGDARASLTRRLDAQPGASGSGGALLLRGNEECSYAARGNLDLAAGTLSFWVRGDAWPAGASRHRTLFEVGGTVDGLPFQLFVDSPPEPNVVRLVIMHGSSREPRQKLFQIVAPVDWRRGWQKVDVSWDEQEIAIYGNGRVGERIALASFGLPTLPNARFQLTPRVAPGDRTLVDEVEIWSAPLPADRIQRRFVAAMSAPPASTRVRAPRWSGASPRPDGVLDEPGWKRAARIPLLTDAETGFAGLLVPHATLAWDDAALHVALEAPRTDLASGQQRDAFDLELARAGGAARSWRITPRGLEPSDAAGAAESGVVVGERSWTAEIRIPLASLGRAPARPDETLRFDLAHRPADPGALFTGARLGVGDDPAASASLLLGAESEGARLTLLRSPAAGSLALRVERDAGAVAELEVLRDGQRAQRERRSFSGAETVDLALPQEPGRLSAVVSDPERRELVRLGSRVGPLAAPGMLPVPDPTAGRLGVELDLRWLDGSWRSSLASDETVIEIEDRGPRGVEGPLRVHPVEGRARVELARGLAPGHHALRLRLRHTGDDRELVVSRELDVPELPWIGSRVGESEAVLEPWLPIVWEGEETARVWGRRYRFDGPLLAQVEGRAGPMLRAPMQLRARTSAGEALLRSRSVEAGARTAARAEMRGTAGLEAAGLEAKWSSWIEYDGLVLTTLELTPRAPGLRIDELVLEIPLRENLVRYLRGTREGAAIRRGRVPWDGRRFESAFEPFVWVTNEDEGFLYFAESEANWVGADRPGAVVVRGGADAAIVLRLIGAPVAAPGSFSYRLGFQATPVKPLGADARAWNFGTLEGPTRGEKLIGGYAGFAVAEGLWQMERPEVVRAEDQGFRSRGIGLLYFGTTSVVPDHDPVYRLFEPLWRSAWSNSYPGATYPNSAKRGPVPPHRLTGVCPSDAAWQDRTLHDIERLLEGVGASGVYTDTDDVTLDDNPRHGCGFTDAFGRRGPTWTILAKRRFSKRLAQLVRSAGGKRRYWMTHAHTRLVPPVYAFADFWIPGEELTHQVAANPWFYSDGLDETAWRVEYRGESSGIEHVFLPEFSRASGRPSVDRAPTESLLAMAAVNDVSVSSTYANRDAVGEFWGLRERLGLGDAEFVGYWRADCPLRAVSPDTRASLYRTRKGPVLAVANRAREARTVQIEIDRAALGSSGSIAARDERSRSLLAWRGRQLWIPLAARGYTFVSLRPE